jgi:hypothetical protein
MTWQALDLAADEFESEPKPPAIARLLYSGLRHALSGPPESVKTIVAWILMLEHVRAGNTVAVVDFEMGPYATRRLLLDLGFTLDEIREHVVYYEAPGEPKTADITELREAGVTLVVIDAAAGAYDASSLDDNKRQDVERFARAWIRPLFDASITSVLIDHVTKNSETRGRYMIGSERKLGGLDVHFGLELVGQPLTRGGSAIVRVLVHKDRTGHLRRPVARELHLHSDPESHLLTSEWKVPAAAQASGEWRPTIYMERYLEVSKGALRRAALRPTAAYQGSASASSRQRTSSSLTATSTRSAASSSRLARSDTRFQMVPARFPTPTGTRAPLVPRFPSRSRRFPEPILPMVPTVPPPMGGNREPGTEPTRTTCSPVTPASSTSSASQRRTA